MNNKTMKKWFSMFALFLLAGFSSASAQQLVIDDVQLKAGETAELKVKLASGAITVYGFQTDIVLPEALTMEVAPKGVAASMADDTDPAFSVNQQADGAYRIAAFSLGGAAFKPETAVATFTVKAAEDFSNVNGAYVGIALKNTKFTIDANGTEINGTTTGNVVDAGLYTYPVRPVTIGFEDTPSVPAGIVTYAADREGLQVSGMQPVRGWTAASNGDARSAGVFDAGSATSFLGSTGFYAPATNPDGLTPKMLGILAVWTATAQYLHPVFLKAGEYYMTVNVFNAGGNQGLAENLIGFIAADGTEYFAETTDYPVGEWKTEQIRIVLPEDTYGNFSLGYTAMDAGKADMPHLFFDGINFSNEIFPNNFRAYHFTSKRGGLGVRSTSVVITDGEVAQYGIYAAEVTDFAVVTYNNKTYLYSIPDKKFVKSLDANLLAITNYDPEPFDISEWAQGGYHFVFGGNTLNINGNSTRRTGYVINNYAVADVGNQIQVESVGDFDPAEALAILAAPEATPAVTTTPVAGLAGLSNTKAYVINGVRSLYWGVTDKTVTCNPVLLPNEEKEQFAVLQAGGNYYLYSIAAKKFLSVDVNFGQPNSNGVARPFIFSDEPTPIEIIETGNASYPFQFKFNNVPWEGGWVVNFNGSSLSSQHVINAWTAQDEGNCYAISEVGDFDATDVMALLPQELGDGEYVFQNCETGQFLFGANSWGTQASLIDGSQYLIMHKLEDGRFNIETQQNNGGESYWLGWGDINAKNSIYVDCDKARAIAFTMEPVGEGIYNIITDTDKFLAAEEGTTVVAMIDEGSLDAAKWRIVATADVLKEASETNPVDATYLIKDADFDRNNRWNMDTPAGFGHAWTMTAANQNLSGGNNENRTAESWHSTFELKQVIANAPKGVYRLSANAFYRDDSNGALTKLPVLFANDQESAFPQVEDGTLPDGRKYRDQGVLQMGDASNWFAAGEYPVAPIFFELDAAGDITIGVKYDQAELLWAIWDKFHLTYYGPDADITSVQIEGRDAILDELYDKAVDLADDGYPEEITIALGHAIETADDVKALVPPTKEAYDKAIAELQEAIAAADAYVFPATEMNVDINLECGGGYEGVSASVDVAAILAELGATSLDGVVIAAVQPDGTYDTNYSLGPTDGWRNAEGGWQAWTDNVDDPHFFYVKADFYQAENQLYEIGGYPGKTDEPSTFTAVYSFKYAKAEVLLKVNVIYSAPTMESMYADALEQIEDGANYLISTVVDGTKYYLTAAGTLSVDKAVAGQFTFAKASAASHQWEYGFKLSSQENKRFSNPYTTTEAALTNGSLNTSTNNRDDWEAQVFFLNSDGLYAVRSTNAPYNNETSGWNWIGNTYWTANEGPLAEYSWEPQFIWNLEKNVIIDVVANLVVNGNVIATETVQMAVDNAPLAPASFVDQYHGLYSFQADVDVVAESTTEINFTPVWGGLFQISSSYASARWYKMNIRTSYWVSWDESEPYYPTTDKDLNAEASHWAFLPVEGEPFQFYIINQEAGSSESLSVDGENVVIRPQMTAWELFGNNGGFVMRPVGGGENDWVNQNGGASGPLQFWHSANGRTDDGSTFRIEPVIPDGIYELSETPSFEQGVAYDLNGRKVVKMQVGGIYIVNGKKVLVK